MSEAIKKRHLYQNEPSKGPDMCKVPLLLSAIDEESNTDAWKSELKNKQIQKERLIPFNYFTDAAMGDDGEGNTEYRVYPIKNLQSSEAFSRLFRNAAKRYEPNRGEALTPESIQGLRRLGVLLHIVSDSFAYVPFNGYQSNVNAWKIVEVKDSRTFKDITKQYNLDKYAAYPNIGKFKTGSVCDDYNIQFILKNNTSMSHYTRLSNDYFAKTAKAVYGFLCNFIGKTPSDQDWRDNLLPGLIKGWNTDLESYADLQKHWSDATGVNYDYDADAVRQSIVELDPDLQPEQQEYFDFLLIIQDVRETVLGILQEADDMLSENKEAAHSWECEVSEPNFTGDDYELNISATLPAKLDSLALIVTIFDTDTEELIKSEPYTYKSVRSINEKMILGIPDDNQNLVARLSFTWKNDSGQEKKTFTKNYTVFGNSTVISQLKPVHPVSRTGRPAIQIVNGTSSTTADYNYPLNAMYISQTGNSQLDLYTPIDLQMKLDDGFKLLGYSDLHITLTSLSGQSFRYCNNSKFVTFKGDPDTGLLHLKAAEEWKNRLSTREFSASIARMKLAIQITLEVSSGREEGYRNIMIDTGKDDQFAADIEYMWNL
ncbi:hypothetical protein M1D61_10980 [Paenibacillus sp. Z6-24]